MHEFTQNKDDYIAYGVRFSNMRKVLTLRAPYVFINRTDQDYLLKLTHLNESEIKVLKPQQTWPIGLFDMPKSF
jgi:hypothetical protein